MKRIGLFVSLLLLLFVSSSSLRASALPQDHAFCAATELPWSIVQAVLKKVADLGDYTYAQLEYKYDNGSLTVAQHDGSYLVTIYEDGITTAILIENL